MLVGPCDDDYDDLWAPLSTVRCTWCGMVNSSGCKLLWQRGIGDSRSLDCVVCFVTVFCCCLLSLQCNALSCLVWGSFSCSHWYSIQQWLSISFVQSRNPQFLSLKRTTFPTWWWWIKKTTLVKGIPLRNTNDDRSSCFYVPDQAAGKTKNPLNLFKVYCSSSCFNS